LTDTQGRRLATSYYPAPGAWLNVLISHGYAEHRGWWHHVAAALQAEGINVLTFDHFCHGASDGPRGDVADYGLLTGGLRLALEAGLLPRAAGLPIVLLGHSNGGLASLLALGAIHQHLAGLVLCSPLLGIPGRTLAWAWPMARLIAMRDPGRTTENKLRPWRLTHNRELWDQYRQDPLRLHHMSARFFLGMIEQSRAAAREASCQGLPLLLLSAGEDVVVSVAAMGRWFERAQSADKQRIDYPHARHELFNESNWTLVLGDVTNWLTSRFRPQP
jgi:alpha-beta hydrolase superfamily lysophospholipase